MIIYDILHRLHLCRNSPKKSSTNAHKFFVHREIFRRQKVDQVLIYKLEKNLNLQVVTWIVAETLCMGDFNLSIVTVSCGAHLNDSIHVKILAIVLHRRRHT